MSDDIKKVGGAPEGEPLEKRSKNVREKTKNITPEQAHQRILGYIRRKGFEPKPSTQDRFGAGTKQRDLLYGPSGNPEHELGHALMTPVNTTLRDYQKQLGSVSGKSSMHPEDRRNDEFRAFAAQPGIMRRAGVAPQHNTAIESNAQRESRYPSFRAGAERVLNAYDEGRRVIDSKGKVVRGTGIHAKINERAMAKSEDKKELAPPQWLSRPILHPEHVQDLETRAAINEFHHKLPRAEAEQRAHDDYVKEQRERAAAHHLAGMKAAMATGNHQDATKHWALYDLHLKALGKESIGAVPPEIEKRMMDENGTKPLYRFKAHKGDLYALHEPSKDQAPAEGQPIQKSEAKQCKWRLGERRCQRMVTTGYCHDHKDHWANKIKQKEAKEQPQGELAKGDVIKFPGNNTPAQPKKKPARVSDIATAAAERKKQKMAHVKDKIDAAFHAMASDPGMQAAAREREIQAKKDQLKRGGQKFKPGDKVVCAHSRHTDAPGECSYPWVGTVSGHEPNIDRTEHHYTVKWQTKHGTSEGLHPQSELTHAPTVQKAEDLSKGDVIKFPGNPAPKQDKGAPAPVVSMEDASIEREKKAWEAGLKAQHDHKQRNADALRSKLPKTNGTMPRYGGVDKIGRYLADHHGNANLADEKQFAAVRDGLAQHLKMSPEVVHQALSPHRKRNLSSNEDLGHVMIEVSRHLNKK